MFITKATLIFLLRKIRIKDMKFYKRFGNVWFNSLSDEEWLSCLKLYDFLYNVDYEVVEDNIDRANDFLFELGNPSFHSRANCMRMNSPFENYLIRNVSPELERDVRLFIENAMRDDPYLDKHVLIETISYRMNIPIECFEHVNFRNSGIRELENNLNQLIVLLEERMLNDKLFSNVVTNLGKCSGHWLDTNKWHLNNEYFNDNVIYEIYKDQIIHGKPFVAQKHPERDEYLIIQGVKNDSVLFLFGGKGVPKYFLKRFVLFSVDDLELGQLMPGEILILYATENSRNLEGYSPYMGSEFRGQYFIPHSDTDPVFGLNSWRQNERVHVKNFDDEKVYYKFHYDESAIGNCKFDLNYSNFSIHSLDNLQWFTTAFGDIPLDSVQTMLREYDENFKKKGLEIVRSIFIHKLNSNLVFDEAVLRQFGLAKCKSCEKLDKLDGIF